MKAVGSILSGETAEGEVLLFLVLISKTLDNLGSAVHFMGDLVLGESNLGLRVSRFCLLGTVEQLVLED